MRRDQQIDDHRALHVVHALPGRVRVHAPHLRPNDARAVEALLRVRPVVRAVRVDERTRNVLVEFDPALADAATVTALVGDAVAASPARGAALPAVVDSAVIAVADARSPAVVAPAPVAPGEGRPSVASAAQLVALGLDLALALLRGGGRRPPVAVGPPWLPLALGLARLLLRRVLVAPAAGAGAGALA